MEYNTTITQMSTVNAFGGDVALSSRVVESYVSVADHVDALQRSALNHSDTPPKTTWSSFHNRTGHLVEKCAIEWEYGNTRMIDVVWVIRGWRG